MLSVTLQFKVCSELNDWHHLTLKQKSPESLLVASFF
ncbi:hypothetical protein Sbal223_2364 [Shewanella baltica OS223]|nr:hypothetical protein Sbal223_2364 [Shewanella baltica OS223]